MKTPTLSPVNRKPNVLLTRTALTTASLLLLASLPHTAGAQTSPQANLQPKAEAPSQTVEIQGVRAREKAGQSTLTSADLARVPGSGGDPMKAIQSLPGVASADDSSSEPAVRGARPSDNQYLVDFLPVGYLFHVGGFASVFNADLIRRFDMYSAAWSPEYGDALGAVFDLSLRRPRTDRIGGKLDFSLLGATALIEGPLGDDKSFFLSARRSWFDLVAKTGEDKKEGLTFTTPVYTDTQGRFLWTLNRDNRVRFDFSTAADRLSFNVKTTGRLAQQEPVLAGDSTDKRSYTSAALVWDADLASYGAHTLALGNMVNRQSSRVGSAGSISAVVTTSYLRHQVQLPAWESPVGAHEFTLGGSVQRQRADIDVDFKDPRCTEFDPNCDLTSAARVLTKQNDTQSLADLYINDRWRLAKQWTATAGLRYSKDGYLKRSYTEPRLGLEWAAPADLLVTAGVGRHNQAPAIDQSLRGIGNPGLAHLRSTHAAFGVSHRLAGGWTWKAEVYGKRFEDLVVSDAATQYRNGASGTARGFELLVKHDAGSASKFSGFAALSLAQARRRNDLTGERFAFDYDQPVALTLVGQYKQNDRWSYGLKWSYHSGAPYTPITGTSLFPDGRVRPVYGAINSQRVPDYHRLDLRVDAKFSPRFTAYAELINAYARKNVAGYSYSADYKTREETYQLPTLPSVGLQYTF
jgi:TonB dependent receptor/TonB-dependent Receptor Plug Domain